MLIGHFTGLGQARATWSDSCAIRPSKYCSLCSSVSLRKSLYAALGLLFFACFWQLDGFLGFGLNYFLRLFVLALLFTELCLLFIRPLFF